MQGHLQDKGGVKGCLAPSYSVEQQLLGAGSLIRRVSVLGCGKPEQEFFAGLAKHLPSQKKSRKKA